MKKSFFAAVLFVAFSSFVFAQMQTTSLVAASYKSGEEIGETHELYRYDFVNGEYVGRELIASSKDIYFHSSVNQIYRNRYAISSGGDIVDVLKKKILHESTGKLHRIEGDKIYIEENNDKHRGLYAYDLTKQKYLLIRPTKFGLGELSPNGLHRLWANDNSISIYTNGKSFPLKSRFNLKVVSNINSSEMLKVGALWLDDNRFLTQQGNGKLVIADIKGNVKPLLKIPNEPECEGNPRFWKDSDGKYFYYCSQKYEIDLQKKTFKIAHNDLGFGFDTIKSDGIGTSFTYKGEKIGQVWSMLPRTIKGFLVVLYADDNENLGYPKGVKVWNEIKKDWTAIEIDWGAHLVGWIN
ncbi:MAG TPA: hypothetical protein PKY59_14585 [Pyrinomonadaceae bacterium]|nr:hypothetical protein [Pyrinomonadaceae bacterium]